MAGNKCPHCDNDTGFFTIVKTVEYQIYNWYGNGVDSSTISVKEGKMQRCNNCRKIVRVKLAHEK